MVDQRFSRLLPTLIAGVALILPAGVLKTSAQRAQVSAPSDDADQPVRTSVQNPGAVAIVIGIGQYQDRDIPPAGYAVNDADAVVRVLTQTLGYSPQRVIQLKNEQASFGRIRAAVRNRLAALAQPDKSDVFFYYSGHGEPNVRTREGFLIPYDFDSQDQPSPETAYGLKDLYADLAGLNARSVTVVIESCFSGQSKNGPLLKSARPLGIEVDNPALGLANGVVITASGAAEIASDHPERPHGLMTYYWLRAMRGEEGGDDGSLCGISGCDGLVRQEFRRADPCRGAKVAQWMGAVRNARERVGVGRGLVRLRILCRGGRCGSEGAANRNLPRDSRRFLVPQSPAHPRVQSQLQRAGLQELQRRVSLCPGSVLIP